LASAENHSNHVNLSNYSFVRALNPENVDCHSKGYQAAESDAERRENNLEMGKLDGRRHAEIYDALEDG
jgi:hypothetical protein